LRRKKGFLLAGSEDALRNNTKQLGFGDEARKRIGHAHAQCKNDQSVLGIIPALNRVIPTVKQFKERTNKAGQQNNHNRYSRRPRPHAVEYSAKVLPT
jgi:hypothetical protein